MANLIYIASPFRIGHLEDNVRASLVAAEEVISLGYTPYPPLLNFYWSQHFYHDQDWWLNYDLEMLARCDALVRLPGESAGADGEVKFAEKKGIPVYYGLDNVPRLPLKAD